MSDSVVPTPSEKPTCRHGFDRGHDLGVTIGGGEFAVVDCPGPVIATTEKCECGNVKPHKAHSWLSGFAPNGGPIVTGFGIATPKKCKIEKESGFCDTHESYECPVIAGEDYHDGPFLCPICGRHLPCRHCNDVTVATEPETPSYIPNLSTDGQQKPCDARCGHNNHRIGCLNDPVHEATCEVHLEKDGRLRVTAWVRPDQMYATLSALQSTASDPTPEMRDAIKAMKHVRNYAEDGTYFIALSRAQIDAVLSTLGEKK